MNSTTQRTVIWAAMVGSVGVYLLLGVQLGGQMSLAGGPRQPILPIAFGVLALGSAFGASLFWRRAREAEQQRTRPVEYPEEAPPVQHRLWILAWVLDEGVAVLGFVLAMMGFPLATWIGFVLGAAVLLTLHR